MPPADDETIGKLHVSEVDALRNDLLSRGTSAVAGLKKMTELARQLEKQRDAMTAKYLELQKKMISKQ